MVGVNFQQLAEEFHELTGRNPDFPVAPFNSLYFIKALNCWSGVVEIHNAVADDSYATSKVHAVTPIQVNDAPNGTWVVESKDVYFIKTANTGTGSIEVYRLSSGSTYSTLDLQQPSGFSAGEASNGIFTIDKGDLYFIKTKNTDSGFIELHMAGHQKSFAKVEHHATSTFQCGDASNGYLTIRGGDLYLIKGTPGVARSNCTLQTARRITRTVSNIILGSVAVMIRTGLGILERRATCILLRQRSLKAGVSKSMLQQLIATTKRSLITPPCSVLRMDRRDFGASSESR